MGMRKLLHWPIPFNGSIELPIRVQKPLTGFFGGIAEGPSRKEPVFMLEYRMHFGDTAEWFAFTHSSCTSNNVEAIPIFPSAGWCKRLKVWILSKVFAMIRTHRHNEGLNVDTSSSHRRNKSVEFDPLAMFVCFNVSIKTLVERVSLFLGHR